MMKVKQREIYLANLDPTVGHEQKGTRPVIVISAAAVHKSGLALVCPFTTTKLSYPNTVYFSPSKDNGLTVESCAMPLQSKCISHRRFIKKLGMISASELANIFTELDQILDR